ncbi:MAG TPA: PKD domain-containing protein [Patescibacteria group bacterium]|nr:PKD domain-containing protein [Patescibacteria group bacterium]
MRFAKRIFLFALTALVFAGVSSSLMAWVDPIIVANESGKTYEDKVAVQFHPSGVVYVACMAHDEELSRKEIYLFKYTGNGSKGELVGKVSAGKKYCYEPDMVVSADGTVHISWAEAATAGADQQSIMYRTYENGIWSSIIILKDMNIPGTLDPSSFNKEKIDDLNLDIDSSGNVFVTFMTWPGARCKLLSRYGTTVREENWPLGGRSKHPSVQAGDDYVQVTWQQLLGQYTVYYARRKNIVGAAWENIDIKGGIHRPVMELDQNDYPHIAYMADDSSARHVVYKYWLGSKFSNRLTLTEVINKYQNVDISVKDDKNMIVSAAVFKGTSTEFFFNWKKNGLWNPLGMVPVPGAAGAFDNPAVALSKNDVAAFVYNLPHGVYLILSERLIINELPVAVISADKETVYWDEEITFNGSGSSDNDGTIVKYEWKVIQDNETLEGQSVTYKFNKSYNNVRVRLTVIDDKDGRGIAEKVVSVKALYTAPATWSMQQVKTLIYNRQGNVIRWEPNPKNDVAGYNIVKYKIFRREADGDYQEIGEVGAEKRAFADISIEAGKTYYYAVSAVDDQGHKSPYDNF